MEQKTKRLWPESFTQSASPDRTVVFLVVLCGGSYRSRKIGRVDFPLYRTVYTSKNVRSNLYD